MTERDFQKSDQQEKVISIDRVTKVVKGGKNMRFRTAVVVGDLNGRIGLGISKSIEIPKAIRKAIENAKKSQIKVGFTGTSIAHEVFGKFGASKVVLKPATKGTGVIAGGAVKLVLELAGIKDVVAKSLGSSTTINLARATIDALKQLMNQAEMEKLRGIKLSISNVSEKTINSGEKSYNNGLETVETKKKELVSEEA
jgi:small subunit ribosomal protein S5